MILALALAAPLLFQFQVKQPAEITAELSLSAPDCDWAVPGKEAAVADVYLDGKAQQNVFVFGSASPGIYHIFLGRLSPGQHDLRIERNAQYSAPACNVVAKYDRFQVHEIPPGHAAYAMLANAPILYARKNTIGKFSDIPLLAYADQTDENGEKILQYTVIFSNEDGGTNTRALMARWGRTTDIEYVYRGPVRPDGLVSRAIIQGRGHKDVDFSGKKDGTHPILIPVTDNNMVGDDETSALRFQIVPGEHNDALQSREAMMPPWTYEVMTKEMIREGKLRPYGVLDGDKISDPRNYLYVDYDVKNRDSAVNVNVRLKTGQAIYGSSLGRLDYAISRDGWVQTTVELPPNTRPDQIADISFECLVAPPEQGRQIAHSGTCHIGGAYAFLLRQDFAPAQQLRIDVNADFPTGRAIAVVPSNEPRRVPGKAAPR
jgi:hypothetical protein